MNRKKQLTAFVASALMVAQPVAVFAAPGTLSQDPLFIGTNVQPNILFVVDDSGSMNWAEILNQGTRSPGNAVYGGDIFENFIPADPDFVGEENSYELRRLSCVGYNVMAYNPSRTYVPWEGVDSAGNSYGNQSLNSARTNPYDTNSGVNISNHVYFVWNDADNDGEYDGPTGFGADPRSDGTDECGNVSNNNNGVLVSSLSAAQETNYANWFSYYRKREYVAKRALSAVITQSTARLGLASLHNNNGGVGTEITDVDNLTPTDSVVVANATTRKNRLMRNLFRIDSSGGTPLRQSLLNAGNYFDNSQDSDSGVSDLFGFDPYESPRNPGALSNSPILTEANGGSCQKNFTILLSDGFWNGGSPLVGNTDGPGAGNTAFDGGSYADTHSNTLADVAMRFYERDLATGLPNRVTTSSGVNPDNNSAQHMVTYTVAFGVNGSLSANPPNSTGAFTWPEPVRNTNTTIDDMRHAAWNGRGEFLSAGNPESLISSFNDTLSDIQSRISSASSVSFNSTSLDNGASLFRAEFNPAGWTGDIRALSVSSTGVGSAQWSAALGLNSSSTTANGRQIITYNGTQGIPFRWPANYASPTSTELSSAQVSDLIFGITDTTQQSAYGLDMLNFIRGDHAQEAQESGNIRGFRNRLGSRLGDIVHSAPVFVGTPDARYPDDIAGSSNPYSTFISNNSNRRQMIYVGANDGMLHGFDANNGAEVFAYIPNFLFSSSRANEGLHYLADDNYAHRSYVDLTPTTADVFVNGAWRTYLAGGARSGGRGVFVLDVTNPGALVSAESNANNIVVAELDSTDDPDLGFTHSQITIAKMNNNRWAAIFGNGYNNTGDGTAKIFILYLDATGGYIELETGMGDNDSATTIANNGMSTPEVLDLDNNGTVDRIYAGDVLGNMWAFDVSGNNSSTWRSAYGSAPVYTPFFVAGNSQPITSKPSVDAHPNRRLSQTAPNLLVTFGTGQYLTTSDPSTSNVQTFYGVWDGGVGNLRSSDLVQQTITETDVSGVGTLRTNSNNPVNYNLAASNRQMGWFINLLTPGGIAERNVVDPAILGPVVFFNTLIPESARCAFGGRGFLMSVDLLTGGQPRFPVIDIPNNNGVYSGISSAGVPTAPTFVSNRDADSGRDATRYVNTSRGIESGNISFGANNPSRTSWTNLTR